VHNELMDKFKSAALLHSLKIVSICAITSA